MVFSLISKDSFHIHFEQNIEADLVEKLKKNLKEKNLLKETFTVSLVVDWRYVYLI